MTGIKPVSYFSKPLSEDMLVNEVSSLRRICFTGVRGVGKSTLMGELNKLNLNICFTSGSDILQEMMGDTYSQFEYLPEYQKYACRLKIRDILYKMQEQTSKDLLVDSHLTVYNLKTQNIDVIFTHMDYGFYTDIILLDSNPERILIHRQRDVKKKRIVDEDIIKKELDFERKMAEEIAKEHGMQLHVIHMREDATDNLKKILMS